MTTTTINGGMTAGHVTVTVSSDGQTATVSGASDDSASASLFQALNDSDDVTKGGTPNMTSQTSVTPASAVVNADGTFTMTPAIATTKLVAVDSKTTSSPSALVARAKLANTIGGWMVNYLQGNAFASGSMGTGNIL